MMLFVMCAQTVNLFGYLRVVRGRGRVWLYSYSMLRILIRAFFVRQSANSVYASKVNKNSFWFYLLAFLFYPPLSALNTIRFIERFYFFILLKTSTRPFAFPPQTLFPFNYRMYFCEWGIFSVSDIVG